jgi:hypothetical protein
LSNYTAEHGAKRFAKAPDHPNFIIPASMKMRVPRNWISFLEEVDVDLKDVRSTVYEGGVTKGLRNGMGKIIYANGEVYKGNFKNGVRDGNGTCKFPNGCVYRGAWRDDQPAGMGLLFSRPNEMVEARFENWKVGDGYVKILFANGEFYEGHMKNNMRN